MDSFLFICKKIELDKRDMEDMTIGMCLDYFDEFVRLSNPNHENEKVRHATQEDYDNF